jgi:DNA-binding GntR family transcriptional regulator
MNSFQQGTRKPTARRHVAAILGQEIVENPKLKDFLIGSEHQLCKRFGVCRVTIRLALSDLENKGLIYRRHGKGTFAHGSASRVHPCLGIHFKSAETLKCPLFIEFLRGIHTLTTSFSSAVVLLSASPLVWQTETIRILGAVIVMHEDFNPDECNSLKSRKLPFICISNSQLASATDCFDLGVCTAEALNQAAFTGEPVDQRTRH